MSKVPEPLNWMDLDMCRESLSDTDSVRLTERNLTALWRKQCDLIVPDKGES